MKILFVCVGNEERSQMAQGYYNYLTKSQNASSAGVWAWRTGLLSHPSKNTVAAMKEIGINIYWQRVKLLTNEMVKQAEKVIVLCDTSFCDDYPILFNNGKVEFKIVPDPIGSSIEYTRQVRDEVKNVVLTLI